MKQHYTQSKRCRNLRTWEISRFSETQAYAFLEQIRFADNGGKPYCFTCYQRHVIRRGDGRLFCTKCRKAFSILSGTTFDHNRVPLSKLLTFVAHFVTTAGANSSPEYGARLELNPRTSFNLLRKIRMALALDQAGWKLRGEIEADTCLVGGYKRKLNDRALEKHLKATKRWKLPKKKVLGVVRERAGRVRMAVVENDSELVPFIEKNVAADSKIFVDSAGAWQRLGEVFPVSYINHSEFYHTDEASTQYAEVAFRRVRRAEKNYIHISGDYLDLYGAEMAFRETFCRHSDTEKFLRVWAACLRHEQTRRFPAPGENKCPKS